MGSLAGAAHLLNHTADVLRPAEVYGEQKSLVGQKGEVPLDYHFYYTYDTDHNSVTYRLLSPSMLEVRGARNREFELSRCSGGISLFSRSEPGGGPKVGP